LVGGQRSGRSAGKNGKTPSPPVHDDLCAVVDDKGRVRHESTATGPNELWLADHRALDRGRQALRLRDQGRLLQPHRGLFDRLTDEFRIAVTALDNAIAHRRAEGAE
jgi:hypothetical protein